MQISKASEKNTNEEYQHCFEEPRVVAPLASARVTNLKMPSAPPGDKTIALRAGSGICHPRAYARPPPSSRRGT